MSKALTLSNAHAWGRAIGKVLDVSPSEMYLRAAVESYCQWWMHDYSYDSFEQDLVPVLGKISVKHLSFLCLTISGLDSSQSDVLLFRDISPPPHKSREGLEIILQGLQNATRSKSGFSTLELDALVREIASLIELQHVLEMLPVDGTFRTQAKQCFASDSTELKEIFFIDVLLSPTTSAESIRPLHKLLLQDKDALNSLLRLSIEAFRRLLADASGLDVKLSAEDLLQKSLTVFDDAEVERFHCALRDILAECSDALPRCVDLALVLKEYDARANDVVMLIESKLLLSQMRFAINDGDRPLYERLTRGSSPPDETAFYLGSEQQRSKLLSAVLDALHPVDSSQLRLVLVLMRVWGMSCTHTLDELTSLWAEVAFKPQDVSLSTNRSLTTFANDWQQFLSVAKDNGIEDIVVETLLIDINIVNWCDCKPLAGEERAGFTSDAGALREWVSFLSDANKVIIDVVLGGDYAESALARIRSMNQLDECLLLFIPVAVSAEALYRFPHLHILAKSMMERYSARITSRCAESLVADDVLQHLSLHDLTRMIGSKTLPMVFSPLPILSKLCLGGNVFEAALLHW